MVLTSFSAQQTHGLVCAGLQAMSMLAMLNNGHTPVPMTTTEAFS
jgi:hypothetical protein